MNETPNCLLNGHGFNDKGVCIYCGMTDTPNQVDSLCDHCGGSGLDPSELFTNNVCPYCHGGTGRTSIEQQTVSDTELASMPQSNQVDTVDELLNMFDPFDNSHNDFLQKKPVAHAKLNALLVAAEKRAELYGRLHQTIEMFQKGRISAAVYSELYDQITEELEKQREATE